MVDGEDCMADIKAETTTPSLPAAAPSAAPLVPQKSSSPAAFKKGNAVAPHSENENKQDKDEEKKEATPEEEAKIKAIAADLAKTGLDPVLAENFARALVMAQRNKQDNPSKIARQTGPAAENDAAFNLDGDGAPMQSIAGQKPEGDFPHDGVIMGQDTAFIGQRSSVKDGDNLYGPGVYKRNEQGQLERVQNAGDAKNIYGDLKSQHDKVMNGEQKGQNLSFKDGTPTFTNLTDAKLSMTRAGPDGSLQQASDLAGSRKNPDTVLKAGAGHAAGAPKAPKPASPIDRDNAEDIEEVPDKYTNASAEADDIGAERMSPAAPKPEEQKNDASMAAPKALPAPTNRPSGMG